MRARAAPPSGEPTTTTFLPRGGGSGEGGAGMPDGLAMSEGAGGVRAAEGFPDSVEAAGSLSWLADCTSGRTAPTWQPETMT